MRKGVDEYRDIVDYLTFTLIIKVINGVHLYWVDYYQRTRKVSELRISEKVGIQL